MNRGEAEFLPNPTRPARLDWQVRDYRPGLHAEKLIPIEVTPFLRGTYEVSAIS